MNDILNKLHEAAASPRAQMDGYLAQGKKIVLCAPVYTPEEIIHSMGFVPMGAWGGDVALNRAKEYCPAFLCAIVQSLLELGISAVRGGGIVGEHEVLFCGAEEVLTLSHSAGARTVFAEGAIQAALFLDGQQPGMYAMTDLLRGKLPCE